MKTDSVPHDLERQICISGAQEVTERAKPHRLGAQDIAVVAAVNDETILKNNLLRSPLIVDDAVPLCCYRGFRSASAAYNTGLDETHSEIVVFVHQDVFLPPSWKTSLLRAIDQLEQDDPHWAVLGAFGLSPAGRAVGHVWSSGLGRRLGKRFKAPVPVECLDELILIVRRDSEIRFDANLLGFHLYGTDIVLAARAAGLGAYVADLPVIHNSRPVQQLGADYLHAYGYMKEKWRDQLPIRSLIAPITRSSWPLLKTRLRLALTRDGRASRATDSTIDPRLLVQKLDMDHESHP
jgi:hypothetical protein